MPLTFPLLLGGVVMDSVVSTIAIEDVNYIISEENKDVDKLIMKIEKILLERIKDISE